jgi:hypothetical protein
VVPGGDRSVEGHGRLHGHELPEAVDRFPELPAVQKPAHSAVAHHVRELVGGEPGAEGDEHHPGLGRPEEEVEELHPVPG